MMNCYNCGSKKLVYDRNSDSYICQNCRYEYPKQYFFISHSHLDIEKVRIIRNAIEETFFYEPILFFLKCLSEEREINDLLRREIYERIWFIYCKSEHAENSKYVQQEVRYINELRASGHTKHYIEVDLDKYPLWDSRCANYIREQIRPVIKRTKVFLSYSVSDAHTAEHIAMALKANGLTVWEPLQINIAANCTEQMKDHIKEYSRKNAVTLLLISRHYAESRACAHELEAALLNNATLLPVIIDNGAANVALVFPYLAKLPTLSVSAIPTKDELDRLLLAINSL